MMDRTQDDNSTLSISENSRAIVNKIKDHNLLSIGKGETDTNTKDIYMLAVALGMDEVPEKVIKGGESYTRTIYFRDFDKALLEALLLNRKEDTENITQLCDMKSAFALSKEYTDAGFRKIDKLAESSMYDPELMVKKLLEYTDTIYDKKVK